MPSPLDLPTTTDFVPQRGAQVPKRSDAEPDQPPAEPDAPGTEPTDASPVKPKPLAVRECPHCKAVIGPMQPGDLSCHRRRHRG
jgi:hypothetical protein